jgi:hypothetical protein
MAKVKKESIDIKLKFCLFYLSLSGNLFSFEHSSLSAIVPSLRYQKNLFHLSLDSNSDPDPIARLLLTMNSIRSLSLEGSKLNEKVYKSLETVNKI